jgi:phage shock protein C
MIDGVCGGVAAYFSIDPTLVRILWVLLAVLGGSGFILYIAAMIIMPKEPVVVNAAPPSTDGTTTGEAAATGATASASAAAPAVPKNHNQNTKFWGFLLVGVGAYWLLDNLGVPVWHHAWGFPWHIGVPLLLILAGVAFLFGGRNYISATLAPATGTPAEPGASPFTGTATEAGATGTVPPAATVAPARLYRSRTDKKVMGVCGGIATYLSVDPVIVRLGFVIAAFASFGFVVIVYIAFGIIVPKEPAPVIAL